ncbi:MAS20 protein import receptor-domain-containing protein [Rhizoctonia solani]|nr:MAS20 protein import receptor-domain-containing protein [Rhizoctonia solani]
MVETRTVVAVSAASAAIAVAGYMVYFDYKRRNDPEFRKKLRKEKKKAAKSAKEGEVETPSAPGRSPEELKAMLDQISAEPLPTLPADREKYFMDHVGMGEQMLLRGPAFEVPAALAFYRALRAYPSPVEIIMIFQNTLPPHIFALVMQLASLDIKQRAEGYYDVFPPKKMNVKIANVSMKDKSGKPAENDGKPILRSTLVSAKDIKAGDVIYMEKAVVAALDFDLQNLRTHCTHCLRRVDTPISVPDDPLDATYCSKGCQTASYIQSQNVLFGLDPPVPPNPDEPEKPKTEAELVERRKSQEEFVETLRKAGATRALLVARFIASMVAEQSAKLGAAINPSSKDSSPADLFGLPEPEGDPTAYSFYDHVERLKYLEILETPIELEEVNALKKVMKNAMEGLEEFVGDRYPLLKGKLAYNAIGVAFGSGRDDKPPVTVRPEDIERTRTPHGTSRQTGSAFYRVSSYLAHSCIPNVAPSFHTGTSDLHLVANEDIPEGTELTMSYVDVNQGPAETRLEARRRRRQELARGWRFACECPRCLKEVEDGILNEDKNTEGDGAAKEENLELGPEAKLEDAVRRYETGEKPAPEPEVEQDPTDV